MHTRPQSYLHVLLSGEEPVDAMCQVLVALGSLLVEQCEARHPRTQEVLPANER